MATLLSPDAVTASAAKDFLCLDHMAQARGSFLEDDEDLNGAMVEVDSTTTSKSKSRIRILPNREKTLTQILESDGSRALVGGILQTTAFDNFVSLVVVANSVSIALEQARRLEKQETELFKFLELGFLSIYILELGLIFFSRGRRCLSSNWVRFDCVLVLMGIVSSIIDAVTDGVSDTTLSSLVVLRMVRLVRLARLARTMRLVVKFRELWLLARGLVNCMSTAVHTLLFGLILLYVVGCVAVELIPLAVQEADDPVSDTVRTIINENFDSLPRTMLTLVQFITLDNAVNIYKPLIESDPYLTVFFIAVILIVGIVFMNLVTALIVSSGLEQAMKDSSDKKAIMDAKRKRLLVDLERAFHRADANKSGTVTRRELANIDPESQAHLQEILGISDLADMFDFLDVDGSEEIDINEFCSGAASIVLSDTAPEIKRMERVLKSIQKQLKGSQCQQELVAQSVGRIMSILDALTADLPAHKDETGEEAQEDGSNPGADVAGGLGKVKLCVPGDKPRPAWVSEFVAELKEAHCNDMRRAVEEVCSIAMSEVAGDVLSQQSSQWEVLPPTPLPRWPSEGSTPSGRARSRSPELRPRGAASRQTGHDDQQVRKAQPDAAPRAGRRSCGAIPESLRPVLLSGPASGADSGAASARACRQEL